MKKIYFGCSIAGGRDHAHLYADIVSIIKASDAQLLSEMFADKVLRPEVGIKMDPRFVWERDIKWIDEADGLIMEVTQPSLGVGYEIATAENLNKPILTLFYAPSGKRLSPMIAGSPNITVFQYSDVNTIKPAVQEFIGRLH